MSRHIDLIKEEFTRQAATFNEYQRNYSKDAFTVELLGHIGLSEKGRILEVAAGTCAFGRFLAPYATELVELDATEAMLEAGRAAGEQAGITNATYVIGVAEALPFPDASFDAVATRLAFHHFEDPSVVCREMCRVLRPGGKVLILDMLAPEEETRDLADRLQTLRDPSHVRCLSEAEFAQLLADNGAEIEHSETALIPMDLEAWMNQTNTSPAHRAEITAVLETELAGGTKTGLMPAKTDGKIGFQHLWVQIVAKKG